VGEAHERPILAGTFYGGWGRLGCHLHSRYRVPDRKSFLSDVTILFGRESMATRTKMFTDRTERNQEALRMAS